MLLRWFQEDRFRTHPEAGRLYSRLLALLDESDAKQDPAALRVLMRTVAEYFAWLQSQWEFRAAAAQLERLHALTNASPEWPA